MDPQVLYVCKKQQFKWSRKLEQKSVEKKYNNYYKQLNNLNFFDFMFSAFQDFWRICL